MNYYEMLLARKLAKGELPPNAYLLKTASGSLVSFDDGADLPMPSFICNIDAVQDLHGYDYPWLGGAGKNIFCTDVTAIDKTTEYRPNSSQRANLTQISDNSFRATGNNGSWTAGYYEIDGINGTLDYAISYTIKDNNTSYTPTLIKDAHSDESKLVLLITFNNNSRLTTSEGATFDNVQVELGETATAFAPYSNICPISGHTGVEAVISPTIEASDGTTYSVSWQTEAGEVFGGYVDLVSGELTVTHKEITFDGVTDGKKFTNKGTDSNVNYYLFVTDGFLFGKTSAGWVSDNELRQYGMINSHCDYGISAVAVAMGFRAYVSSSGGTLSLQPRLFFGTDTTITTIELANQWLATQYANGTPWQVKYPLAEAQTYQLDGNQIKSLLGNNNAWCSTGDVTLEYFGKGAE